MRFVPDSPNVATVTDHSLSRLVTFAARSKALISSTPVATAACVDRDGSIHILQVRKSHYFFALCEEDSIELKGGR